MSDLFFYSNKESLGNNHLQGILFYINLEISIF